MPKSTCQDCGRTVMMVAMPNGEMVATDTEVIRVVPALQVTGDTGGIRMSQRTTPARRLHAEQCATYVEQGKKERVARELREFNRKNGRTPRRNEGL